MRAISPEAEDARHQLHSALRAVRLADRQVPCEVNPELWTSNNRADREAAAFRCGTCPVRRECSTAATYERVGVWGSTIRAAGSLEW